MNWTKSIFPISASCYRPSTPCMSRVCHPRLSLSTLLFTSYWTGLLVPFFCTLTSSIQIEGSVPFFLVWGAFYYSPTDLPSIIHWWNPRRLVTNDPKERLWCVLTCLRSRTISNISHVVRQPMKRQGFRIRNHRGSDSMMRAIKKKKWETSSTGFDTLQISATKPIAGSQTSLLPNDQPDYVNS